MLVQLACYCNCSWCCRCCSSSWCCCCWARGDDEGVGSVGAAPGVAAAAGMEEKMRSVWGSVDREGCFGCREEMAERGEWPGGGLFLGALSLSPPFNKTLLVLNFFLSPFQKVFPPLSSLSCVLFLPSFLPPRSLSIYRKKWSRCAFNHATAGRPVTRSVV